jgi:hypothetical protein
MQFTNKVLSFCHLATGLGFWVAIFVPLFKSIQQMKHLTKILIIMMSAAALKTSGQIPAHWAQYRVEDTVNLPAEQFWDAFFKMNLEDVASVGDYKDLPKIVKTTPVTGDFSKLGDSRRVHFNTGQTVLESIIEWDQPRSFSYELTELEVELKRAARKARGNFQYFSLPDGRTRVVWTYGFDQKNFIFKWLINRYITTTHRFWMKDTLSEMKRRAELINAQSSNYDH